MKYTYRPPIAERHEVDWYYRRKPGIYEEVQRTPFSSLKLRKELTDWLDKHSPEWSFRSDWDYSNGGDDDEGCHLIVSSREAGEEFVRLATEMSDAWVAADRAKMPIRIYLKDPAGEVEATRAHTPDGLRYELESALYYKIKLPDRRYALFAARDAIAAVREMLENGEKSRTIALRLLPNESVDAGASDYQVRIEIADIPAEILTH